MKINLQIERLALHGIHLTPTERTELAAAVQAELGRLLASENATQNWADLGDQARIQSKLITYQAGSSPIHLGREIAASLYIGIQNGQPSQKVCRHEFSI